MTEDNDNEDFRQDLIDAIEAAESTVKDSVSSRAIWFSGGDLFQIMDEIEQLQWEMGSLIPALDNYQYETDDVDKQLSARAEQGIEALEREFQEWMRLDREERGIPHPEAA